MLCSFCIFGNVKIKNCVYPYCSRIHVSTASRKPVTLEKLESFAMLSDNADDAQNYISKMSADRVF